MITLYVLIYGLMIISFFVLLIRYKLNTLYYLPMYWIIEEILSVFFYEIDSSAAINIMTLIYVIYSVILLRGKILNFSWLLVVFIIIAFFKTPFESDLLSFGNRFVGLFNIYMILPISYFVIKEYEDILFLIKKMQIIMLIFFIYSVIASILKFGPNMYDTGLIYGLNWGQYYGPALIAILTIMIRSEVKISKYQLVVAFFVIIITLLTFRRTAILIVILFSTFYSALSYGIKRQRNFALGIGLALLFYLGITFLPNIEHSDRTTVISSDYDITKEGRFYDIFGVIALMEADNSILTGYELFNDKGNYGAKRDNRPIHVDIMRIFFGVGLIGIVPLMILWFQMLYRILRFRAQLNSLSGVGLGMLMVFLLTLLTGGSLYISFSGFLFIVLGGVLSLADKGESSLYE